MDKHIEIWNIARKLKLGTEFYEGLDTLLTEIENRDQQLILQNVSISLPHLEETLAEKTLLLVSKNEHDNREIRKLKYDIYILTRSINAIKGNEC